MCELCDVSCVMRGCVMCELYDAWVCGSVSCVMCGCAVLGVG